MKTKDDFLNQGKITVPLLTKDSSKQYNKTLWSQLWESQEEE